MQQNYFIIPSYSGSSVTVTLSNDITNITQAIVAGEILLNYQWNPPSLTISPSINASGLSVLVSYDATTSNPLLPNSILESTEITDYPAFLTEFNVLGEFTITRQFQGSPSASLTIIDDISKRSNIFSYFAEGELFTFRDISLRCLTPSIEVDLSTNKLTATITFQGCHDSYGETIDNPVDKPISVKDILITSQEKHYYTPSGVASAAGVSFTGSGQKIYVDDPETTESVTLRSLLSNERFYQDGKIIDWESTTIRLKNWDLMPSLTIDKHLPVLNQSGTFKAKLSNAVLTITEGEEEEINRDVWSTIYTGRADYKSPPKTLKNGYYEDFDVNNLKTAAWCFDVISDKTIRTRTLQLNGGNILVEEEEWGFVYSSVDTYTYRTNSSGALIYTFNLSSPNNFWQLVRSTTKLYGYETSTGSNYLRFVRGSTRQLMRLKQESDKEAVELHYQLSEESDSAIIQQLTNQLNAYTDFFWVTYPYNEEYFLEDLSEYYSDLQTQESSSYFTKQYSKGEGITLSKPDPESTEDEPKPDIVIGTRKIELQDTVITATKPEKFKVKTETSTIEKTNLAQSASSITEEENNGRPSLATNITYFNNSNPNTQPVETNKYLISTDGASLPQDIENGSVSYPDVFSLSKAENAVKTDYSIKNSQNESTLTLTSKTPLTVTMGQRIIYDGTVYRLFGYEETLLIDKGKVFVESVNLTLGREQSVTVSSVKLSGSGSTRSIPIA